MTPLIPLLALFAPAAGPQDSLRETIRTATSTDLQITGTIRAPFSISDGRHSYLGGTIDGQSRKGFLRSSFLEENTFKDVPRTASSHLGPLGYEFGGMNVLELEMRAFPVEGLEARFGMAFGSRLEGQDAFFSSESRNVQGWRNYSPVLLVKEMTLVAKTDVAGIRPTLYFGGVLDRELSPLTLWTVENRRDAFWRDGYEDASSWGLSEQRVEKGFNPDPWYRWLWTRRGVKGFAMDVEGLPKNIYFASHFGVWLSPWSNREAKAGVWSDTTPPANIRDNIVFPESFTALDSIAQRTRFNDEWALGARLAWRPAPRSKEMGINWIWNGNTNKKKFYETDGKGLLDAGYYGPDYSVNVVSLDHFWTFGDLKLHGDMGWSHLVFDNATNASGGKSPVTYQALGGMLDARAAVGGLDVRMTGSFMPSRFWTGTSSNSNWPTIANQPLTWDWQKQGKGDKLANPAVRTLVPSYGDEMIPGNMAALRVRVAKPLEKGHLIAWWSTQSEVDKSNNLIEIPYSESGWPLWTATRTQPNGDRYYDTYAFGFIGRGDALNRPVYDMSVAGLKPDKNKASEVFRYFNPPKSSLDASGNVYNVPSTGFFPNASEAIAGQTSRKSISNLALDAGYDLGTWIAGSPGTVASALYEVRSVDPSLGPLPFGSDKILWGDHLRFDLAQRVAEKWQIVGALGAERWTSNFAWTRHDATPADSTDAQWKWVRTPIDYLDTFWGVGVDWDFAGWGGLHVRYGSAQHDDPKLKDDQGQEPNSFTVRTASVELKASF